MPCDRRHCWMDRRRAQVNRMESQFKLNSLCLLCLCCAVLFSFFLFFIRLLSRWLYECIFSSTSHLIVFTHLSLFFQRSKFWIKFFRGTHSFPLKIHLVCAIQNTSGNPSPKFASTSHKSLASDMNQNFLLLSQRLVCGYTHWGSLFICQMCLNNVCSHQQLSHESAKRFTDHRNNISCGSQKPLNFFRRSHLNDLADSAITI